MRHNTQKIVSVSLIIVALFGGFEILAYILNLNQPDIFVRTAIWVYLYLVIMMFLLFDLHFKNAGSFARAQAKHEDIPHAFKRSMRVLGSALWDRFEHLRNRRYLWLWFNHLIIPALVFWSTILLLYVNFGFIRLQQILIIISSGMLVVYYTSLKEFFYRRKEIMDRDLFVKMSMVKIYASTLAFGAALAVVRYYCLEANLLVIGIFCVAFLLLYYALFQYRLVSMKTLAIAALIAAVMGFLGAVTLAWWGYDYFTAAIFLGASYNLLWGLFHFQLDHTLTRAALIEIIIISLLIVGMVASVTNFRARILDGCNYTWGQGV